MAKMLLVGVTTILMGFWNVLIFAVAYINPLGFILVCALLLAPIPILCLWGDRLVASAGVYLGFFTLVLVVVAQPWLGFNDLELSPVKHMLVPFLLACAVHILLLWGHSSIHRRLNRAARPVVAK